MIQAENLSFSYPDGKKVLNELNFTIDKGDFVAVVGQNGSGKTTLLKHFNGLLKPTAGRMTVAGLDVTAARTSKLAARIGFLFQNPDHQIFCKTVEQEIAFGLKNMGIPLREIGSRVRQAAETVGLLSSLGQDPFSLSKGQRQRVALASVLAMGSEILVLDEPTTGQDYQESIQIMELIRELNRRGKTIILVSHDMDIVAGYARRVIVLREGSIAEDSAAEAVFGKNERLRLSNLQPPQIYLLARHFQQQGLFQKASTVREMFEEIIACLEGEQNECAG